MRRPALVRRSLLDTGTPSLSAGYLVALPLFLAYELGLLLGGSPARSSAERVVARVLEPFEGRLQWARVLLLGLVALAALQRRRSLERGRTEDGRPGAIRLARAAGEGALLGILLGPALLVLQGWLDPVPLQAVPVAARGLPSTLRLVGAAPWEEVLFRVGLYGGLFLVVRRASVFLGLESRLAQLSAEFAALLGSALLFAWFHLEPAQRLLGASGESFHRGLFLWRVSAGVLLGGLFRLRGLGVTAWAHAVFNLGIALGIRP